MPCSCTRSSRSALRSDTARRPSRPSRTQARPRPRRGPSAATWRTGATWTSLNPSRRESFHRLRHAAKHLLQFRFLPPRHWRCRAVQRKLLDRLDFPNFPNMSGKLFIKTHGCQMNEYDSAKMADVLGAAHGLTLTENEAEADVILINTCSIREKAQEKVFSQLGRWRALKQENKAVVIGVGGCVASQEGEAIVKRAPFVDLVFGPQTLHRLPQMIEARRATKRPQVDISFPEIEKFDHLPEPRKEG